MDQAALKKINNFVEHYSSNLFAPEEGGPEMPTGKEVIEAVTAARSFLNHCLGLGRGFYYQPTPHLKYYVWAVVAHENYPYLSRFEYRLEGGEFGYSRSVWLGELMKLIKKLANSGLEDEVVF